MAAYLMAAKFPGTCYACKARIAVGEPILYTKGTGARHSATAQCAAALAAKAAAPTAPVVTLDLAPVAAFLKHAREHGLKFPKVRLIDNGQEITLSLAGDASKNPGAVYVKIAGEYMGLVSAAGEVRGKIAARPAVLELLKGIATNPAGAAKAYAQLTGSCSFCGLQLTDAGSIEVGYGPICAKHYGLPHTPAGHGTEIEITTAA